MVWTNITAPSVGEATKKVSFADAVIGNLVHLYANMGGTGSGGTGMVPNGDFEQDGDTDGIPDGWDLTEYTAGSFDLETSAPGQGAVSVKFTSPGASGGGDLQTTDFFGVSPQKMLVVDFLHWASVAGIHNVVEVRWYSTALEANYISTSTLYDSTSNPTTASRFTLLAYPPSTARFAKLKLVGAKNDTATAGVAYFDSVSVSEGKAGSKIVSIAETLTSTSGSGTTTLSLPALSVNGVVRITIMAESKGAEGASDIHFGIGSYLSNVSAGVAGGSYGNDGPFVIHYIGAGGDVTLTMYLSTDTGTIYGRTVNVPVLIEVLAY